MKSNIKYIISFVLLFILVVIFIPSYVNAEEVVEKGTLRCPPQYLNNGCIEVVENGQVVEVQVTGNIDGASITKYVRKTSTPGELSVWFKANGQTQRVSGDAYIVVILDASTTMGSKYVDKAVPAAKSFAKTFDPTNNSNINLAEISFYKKILVSRNFENSDFDSFDFKKGNILGSRIDTAFDKAKEMFEGTSIPEGAKKFVVVLGDGCYSWKYIENSDGYKYIKDPNNSVDIYSIGWGKASEALYAQQMIDIAGSNERYVFAGDSSEGYQQAFNEIYNKINPIIQNNVVTVNITDSIGEYFSSNVGNAKYKTFVSDYSPYTTETFTIQIDGSAPTGWHNTNKGFEFNDNQFNINPEIYWKQERNDLNACSDSINSSKLIENKTGYYTISCKQDNYFAELKVNNLPINTHKFNITNGTGFPITLELSSNAYCVYDFSVDAYRNAYQEIVKKYDEKMNEYNRTHSEIAYKEAASYEKERQSMVTLLEGYNNNASNATRLSDYNVTFSGQKALLNIKYYDGNYQELYLEDTFNDSSGINCYEDRQEKFNGKVFYSHRVCTLNNKKIMHLPTSCISMVNGEAVTCSDANNLLNGGNNYYVLTSKKGGYVSVTLNKATLFGGDVKLEGDKLESNNPKCEFTISNNSSKVLFRQIELDDPFIQGYTNKTRSIGKNWQNSKYNFVNIIKSNIWSNNYEYQYSMSKVDVENIKADTASEGVRSYLGRNCGFNNNNKYVCEFIRPDSSGKNSYFTKIDIK